MMPPYGKNWRETKEPLDESERGEWKNWLLTQHSENKDHDIRSLTSWQIDGETTETVADYVFLGSKITADCDCSHEIQRHLLLRRKTMTNVESILKSRDITLLTKVCVVKVLVFPVVMYGCESWTIKKAEHQIMDALELWCWRRLLSLLDCKGIKSVNHKGNQSWIFIGRTDAETEAPILWPPDARADSLENTQMLGKIEGRRRRGQQRMR